MPTETKLHLMKIELWEHNEHVVKLMGNEIFETIWYFAYTSGLPNFSFEYSGFNLSNFSPILKQNEVILFF